jgi:(1->4)-alpha-D-glucan 1-alpha-D-glucosylmutase
MQSLSASQLMERADEGLPKLWVVHKALLLRKDHPEWFGEVAEYAALEVSGAERDRVIAFRRGEHVVTVVPRWSHDAAAWAETAIDLPQGRWTNRLSGAETGGGSVLLSELLKDFPVALLTREG